MKLYFLLVWSKTIIDVISETMLERTKGCYYRNFFFLVFLWVVFNSNNSNIGIYFFTNEERSDTKIFVTITDGLSFVRVN